MRITKTPHIYLRVSNNNRGEFQHLHISRGIQKNQRTGGYTFKYKRLQLIGSVLEK